jgi:RNA polymerase sigma factor (sigma-70 family)
MISAASPLEDPRSHGRYGRAGLPRAVVDRIYTDYLRLRSCAKVGALHQRTRQAIWEILECRKLQLSQKVFKEKVVHKGVAYTPMKGGYLRSTVGKPRRLLHHVIWEEANGPIQDTHNVRFRNGDVADVRLDNLECLPLPEVSRLTASGENQHTKARQAARIVEMEPTIRNLAFSTARKNFRFAIDVADLEQVGRIAVRDADRAFDPARYNSFRAYAYQAAKWAMANFVKKHGRNVRAPADKFYSSAVSEVSIHAPVGNDEDSGTFEDLFLGEDESVRGDLARSEQAAAIARFLKRMKGQDALVIRGLFFEGKTLDQLGQELGVTKEAVRQRREKILARLRSSRRLRQLTKEAA